MQVITSKENEFIKHLKKLSDKKYRDQNNEYIIEGVKLLEEAVAENVKIKTVIICDECTKNNAISKNLMYEIAKYNCVYVAENVFKTITQVMNPQGIIAVIEKETSEEEIDYTQSLIVALDDIQDPGNLGTILRTVDSCGLKQILVSKGTADVYNPKVVRSTMGAIFRVKVIECEDLKQTFKNAKKHHFKLVISSLQTDKNIYDIDYNKKIIVIGNEANGVGKEIQDMADEKVIIPMLGKTESLNASVATAVILYEYVRRKITK